MAASAPLAGERPRNLRIGELVGLIAALLCGVALAWAAMPVLFRATPTDVSRIGTILEALHAPGFEPRICVFGNSVIMSGVDGHQLSEALPDHPPAVNLASTGQSLVESYLLQQELPASVRTIIQPIFVSATDERPLEPQKYNTFYMYGFRPTDEVERTLGDIYGDPVARILEASGLSQRFQARWALRQLVDTRLRILLRRDLTLSRAEMDLFHPQRYAKPLGPEKLERSLELALARLDGDLDVPAQRRRLVVAAAREARERGRELLILLPPVHPRIRTALGARLPQAISRFAEEVAQPERIALVDATDSLTDAQFIDALHPTNDGAAVVTELIARRLAHR